MAQARTVGDDGVPRVRRSDGKTVVDTVEIYRMYKDLARLHGIVPPDLPSGHRYRRVETGVPGVSILEDFLSQDEHDLFVAMAEEEREHAAMQGAPGKYDHLVLTMQFIPSVDLFVLASAVFDRLARTEGLVGLAMPAQLTINYYEADEGLAPHTDDPTVIDEVVVGFSLLSACAMDFVRKRDGCKRSVVLRPRSVLIQQAEGRYEWTHGIAPRATFTDGEVQRERSRRVSVQFSDFDLAFFADNKALKIADVAVSTGKYDCAVVPANSICPMPDELD